MYSIMSRQLKDHVEMKKELPIMSHKCKTCGLVVPDARGSVLFFQMHVGQCKIGTHARYIRDTEEAAAAAARGNKGLTGGGAGGKNGTGEGNKKNAGDEGPLGEVLFFSNKEMRKNPKPYCLQYQEEDKTGVFCVGFSLADLEVKISC
ncbi:hypothetical protein H5410_017307 [Solanum commersonii]|uniref:Uncharacterized protein n=1 Tax=Solanum commersonii TaxID=4109 RepID=A0A9J5ZZK5_SOLCO|nr:hypothetical protein H5410_017307 [Solanum commersonii]